MSGERTPGASAREHLAEVYRADPGVLTGSVVMMLLAGLAEGATVVMLVPLLGVAGIPVAGGTLGRVGRAVEAAFGAFGARPSLPGVLLLYVLAVAVQSVFQRWQTVLGHEVEQRTVLRLRRRLYEAMARARWLFLARQRGSDLVHALTSEADRIGSATSYLITTLANAVASAVYLLIALRISPAATVIALGSGAVLLLGLRGMRRDARLSGKALSNATADLFAAASEHVQAVKVVKSYGAEERSIADFSALGSGRLAAYGKAARAYADARAAFMVGSVVLLAAATWLALGVLKLPVAVALLLVFVFSRLVPRLATLQQQWQLTLHDLPARQTVVGLAERCEAEREELGVAAVPIRVEDAIRFGGVRFGYEGREPVLRGVTMDVPARRTTALVGTSGAGKTTIADLLMGLATPTDGTILLGRTPLTGEILRTWRGEIGYVAQDTVLFHQTVRQNLLWARPDASEAELREAMRAAAAEEFVDALPNGLDTLVGDRGVRLSGGERQRLALARALLRRPALLILDEATSALDPENERRILEAIERLHGRTTILLITHRLATVRGADVIHVLDQGRVVESGDWNELTGRTEGRFREMWNAQEAAGEPAPGEGAAEAEPRKPRRPGSARGKIHMADDFDATPEGFDPDA